MEVLSLLSMQVLWIFILHNYKIAKQSSEADLLMAQTLSIWPIYLQQRFLRIQIFILCFVTYDRKSVSLRHSNSTKSHIITLQRYRFIHCYGSPAHSFEGGPLSPGETSLLLIHQHSLLLLLSLLSFHYPTFFIIQLYPPNSSLFVSSISIQEHSGTDVTT